MHTRTLPSAGIRFHAAGNSGRLGDGTTTDTPTSPGHGQDRAQVGTYVVIALVALLAGYVLGLLGGQPSADSRAGWPPQPANPRSLNP